MNRSSGRRSRDGRQKSDRMSGKKFTPTRLRIVSGSLRGRKISYNGDPATRPMKERTREAVFSLLGGKLDGRLALDLFGGTGVLAFESVSRGAVRGIVLELARQAVGTILDNMRALELSEQIEVQQVDTLRWLKHVDKNTEQMLDMPWVVFCCPPYRMWISEQVRLCQGILNLYQHAPEGSQFVCEVEHPFEIGTHIPEITWDVRKYSPALVAIADKQQG